VEVSDHLQAPFLTYTVAVIPGYVVENGGRGLVYSKDTDKPYDGVLILNGFNVALEENARKASFRKNWAMP
jgi:hypothetical protein